MNEAWILHWTEYEFGSRPDGSSLHIDLETAKAFRKSHETGDQEQFWRSTDPQKVQVSDERVKEMQAHDGSIWLTTSTWYKPTLTVA